MSENINIIPEAIWCMHCGAGSRMSFISDPYNFHCPYCNQWNHLDKPLYIKEKLLNFKKKRLASGISSIGGKFRLIRQILPKIPYHEFYLELFLGGGWILLNKERCRYECANDLKSEIINYLLIIKHYPEQFDKMKQGEMGLVSQEICNRIVRGELIAKNNFTRALHFYYLNKLTFGGDVKKIGEKIKISHSLVPGAMGSRDGMMHNESVEKAKAHYSGIQNPCINSIRETDLEKAKERYGDNIKDEYETKGYAGMNQNRVIPNTTFHDKDMEKIKDEYQTKGYVGLGGNAGNISQANTEKAKDEYQTKGFLGIDATRGTGGQSFNTEHIEKVKDEYQTKGFGGMINTHAFPQKGKGRIDKNEIEQAKASYAGINITRALGGSGNKRDRAKWQKKFKDNVEKASYRGIHTIADTTKASRMRDIEKTKEQYQTISHDAVVGKKSQYKGINPVTTRPYSNFDRGLLTPIQPEVIERLRFVNLTCYDFRKVYKLFYNAFYVRKGLTRECFIYADPPYCGVEHYYGNLFRKEDHQDLIDLMLKTPFNFMLSMGGECEMYLEQLKDWTILPVKVKYSTDANHQYDRKEYIITNYEIKNVAKMSQDCQSNLTKFMK